MNLRDLFDQLMQILREPSAEPVRTVLVAGIVVGVFVFVVLVLLLFLPSPEKHEEGDTRRAEPTPKQAALRRWALNAFVAAFVLGIVGGVLTADAVTRRTSFCTTRCHLLDQSVATWQAGAHTDTDCVRCHSTPGVFGPLDTRVRGLANAWASLAGVEEPSTTAVVDQQACRACHATEMRQDIVAGTVRVRHSDFDAEFSCSECHRGVGHSVSGVPPVPSETVMNLCARCHDGQAAPRECKACHTADVLLAGAANSMGKIELPPPADCSGCHDLTPCTTCHQIEMPHPLDWADPKQHAPRGAFDLDPTCGRCHEPGCPECHKALHTNHGADWRTRHQSLPGGTGCVQACHDGEMIGPDMCRLCHPA